MIRLHCFDYYIIVLALLPAYFNLLVSGFDWLLTLLLGCLWFGSVISGFD